MLPLVPTYSLERRPVPGGAVGARSRRPAKPLGTRGTNMLDRMSRYEYWLLEGCSPDEALERVREEGDDSEFEAAYWRWVHWLLNENPAES